MIGSLLTFIAILVDILELFFISISISQEAYYTISQYELEKLMISKEGCRNKGEKENLSPELKFKSDEVDSVFENIHEEESKQMECLIRERNTKKKKVIDVQKTLQCLIDNPVLSVYALGELILSPDFLNKPLLKLNGFFFILKISLY